MDYKEIKTVIILTLIIKTFYQNLSVRFLEALKRNTVV